MFKKNILKMYKHSMNQLKEIKLLFETSKPITLNIKYIEIDEKEMNEDEIKDIDYIEIMRNNLNKTLKNILTYNKDFIISENKLCSEMKKESAKLVSKMEIKSIENEKIRDEEIRNLIKQTRINLEKQYGEYNDFCDKKVENIKKMYEIQRKCVERSKRTN